MTEFLDVLEKLNHNHTLKTDKNFIKIA